MSDFIPEEKFQEIINLIPIFCIDFLIKREDKILLIKRKQEPLKGIYWFPGGRLRLYETIEDFVKRVQLKEIGAFFDNYKLKGFSNYFFHKNKFSRALHTPTLLYEVQVNKNFLPKIDENHSDFIWSKDLPKEFSKFQKLSDINFNS